MSLIDNNLFLGCGCVNIRCNTFCSRTCLKNSYEYLDPSDIDYDESNLTLKNMIIHELFSSGKPLKIKELIPIKGSVLGCDEGCISLNNPTFCCSSCRDAARRDHFISYDDLSDESNLIVKPEVHQRLFKK